jgi:hypothetical protein
LAIDSRLLRANELQEIVSTSQAAGNATGTRVISHLLEIYDLTVGFGWINQKALKPFMRISTYSARAQLLHHGFAQTVAYAWQ